MQRLQRTDLPASGETRFQSLVVAEGKVRLGQRRKCKVVVLVVAVIKVGYHRLTSGGAVAVVVPVPVAVVAAVVVVVVVVAVAGAGVGAVG